MNNILLLYDALETNVDCWIWKPYKTLYLRNIPYKKYYGFLYKYDPKCKDYDYFIIFSNEKIDSEDLKYRNTNRKKSGTIKLDISGIWDVIENYITKINHKVDITLVEEDNVSSVYKINFNP